MQKRARILAYYLPQFHPIPENDEWWGKGFTEWTNVSKARPLFRGHYQPHVPADLGFYDLRLPEVRAAQADLARNYGLEGFCYYHYWFGGRRLLERPFNEVLKSGEPDFPFCLCWANHTWSGIWDGAPDRVLIEQTYPGMKDYEAHFYFLLNAFTDPRYVTIDGKPVFLVYHPRRVPEMRRVTEFWRDLAVHAGLPGLHLVGVNQNTTWNPNEDGFDASVTERLPPLTNRVTWHHPMIKMMGSLTGRALPTIYSYEELIPQFVTRIRPPYEDYPCVIPNWDNTPRSGVSGMVLQGSTPELFKRQMRAALARVENEPEERKIIFLKAWNEWAEGNYVEPDLRFGKGYLQVIKDEILAERAAVAEKSKNTLVEPKPVVGF